MIRKIKEWYASVNPSDVTVNKLNLIDENVTFEDVYSALRKGENIYDALGCTSETVRKYVFQELSDILNVDYITIYNYWANKNNQYDRISNRLPPRNSNQFVLDIPVKGNIDIDFCEEAWDDAVYSCTEAVNSYLNFGDTELDKADKEAKFGVLKNIRLDIPKGFDNPRLDLQTYIEEAILDTQWEKGAEGTISLPFAADLIIIVKAESVEQAIQYAKIDYQKKEGIIRTNLSKSEIVGELKNIEVDSENISHARFTKDKEQQKETEAEAEHTM